MQRQEYIDPIKKDLSHFLLGIIEKSGAACSVDMLQKNFCAPPSLDLGHIAFPCFFLAKSLKKAPLQIASTLAQTIAALPAAARPTLIKQAKAEGPYLNFYLDLKELGTLVLEQILQEDQTFFKITISGQALPKTMIEFSQPNTHKELHVGHMRNLALGDSLIRLYRYCGFPVVSTTFPGDVGTHVAKCLWYLKHHQKEAIPTTMEKRGEFLGKIYTLAHKKLEEELGTPLESENREILTQILKELHQGHGEYFNLWKESREWSLLQMRNLYKWSDVHFDQWYFESEVDAPSVALIKKYLEKGLFVQSEGAVGVDLSSDNLGFCLLLKSDGNGLYATKDIELARRKFEEHKIEKSIYVVDVRQSLHFAQVFKVLELMGFAHAKDCIHLAYDFVELPDGAMSSRKGNIVPIQELIDEMVKLIRNNYLLQYENLWSEEEIARTAHHVAIGAIKYGMLRIDPQRKIVFDLPEWLKIDGESGPYIQYSHARISSLIEKVAPKYAASANNSAIPWEELKERSEEALMLKLADFNQVVISAQENNRPSFVCAYLYDLCKLYNNFYAECSVAHAASPEIGSARLALSKCVREVLREGLSLLGIPAPKRM
ncbi:MAG: arginine--tRNA ligase [Oligoflexia bacterium]|nr:arginine--tRNA ligase [Oligoflexia bacterium]MBF0366789.1 arginine--tRNA ligase [Oligoflexia bacterium]